MRNKSPHNKDQTAGGRFSLRDVWSRVSGRNGKGLLAAAALSSALTSTVAIPPDPVYMPDKTDPAEITAVKKEIFRTAAGRTLLAFAEEKGIKIVLDPKLINTENMGEYDDEKSLATLRPGMGLENAVLVLSHELRHAWQDKVLGSDRLSDLPISPRQEWSVNTYMEADACAFSAWFVADHMTRLHQKIPESLQDNDDFIIVTELMERMKSWQGLTPAAYREIAVQACFADLDSYTKEHVTMAARHVEKIGKHEKAEMTAPSDDDFERWLRRFGGTSLDTTAKTSLQTPEVTRDDILNRYPVTLVQEGMEEENKKLFDETLPKLTEKYNQVTMELSETPQTGHISSGNHGKYISGNKIRKQ